MNTTTPPPNGGYNYNEMDDVELTYDPTTDLRSEETIRQSLAFDMVPDAMLVSVPNKLGLSGCSQEVFDAEMEASQQRRNNIGPAMPVIALLSRLTSEVLNASILVRREEDPETDVNEVAPATIHAASVGMLATLIDMGVVHLPHPETGADA